MKRSEGDWQVAGDRLRARRLEMPCAAGKKVSEAAAAGEPVLPLFAPGQGSIFSRVDIQRVLSPATEEPYLKLDPPIYTVRAGDDGETGDSTIKFGSISLFSFTSKMATASFAVPSGPTKDGGTCLAANPGAHWKDDPTRFVCTMCYALEGRVVFPVNSMAQMARAAWATRRLQQDGPSGLALDLVEAIRATAQSVKPLDIELGIWQKRRIMGVKVIGKRGRVWAPVVPVLFEDESGGRDSFEWVEKNLKPKDGDVAGFFRIHDSGDFALVGPRQLHLDYIEAWKQVARALPSVLIWAPTKLHVFPAYAKAIAENAPSNFIVRPSALHTNAPPPKINGFAMGSGVGVKAPDGSTNPGWACPAYPGGVGNELSCRDHGCRMCWTRPDEGILYGPH